MTTTLTEVRPFVARFAGSCEAHQPDPDSLISDLDANLYQERYHIDRFIEFSLDVTSRSVTWDRRRASADEGFSNHRT